MIPAAASLFWMLVGFVQTSFLVFGLLGLILLWRRARARWGA